MMRIPRRSLAIVVLCGTLVGPGSRADEAKPVEPGPWKYGAVAGLNVSQSSFSSNWAGGDRGSVVWVLNSDLTAARQFSTRLHLSNQLQLAYGQTTRQNADANGALTWDRPDKTTDLIAFESTARFTLQGFADPYGSLRLDSQFRDESNPLGTIAFNPVKLKESVGAARLLQKTDDAEWVMRLGLGFRQTLAKTVVPVTLEKSSFSSYDGGIEWQTDVTQPIFDKKVLFKGQLLVFQPLAYSKSGQLEDFDRAAQAAFPGREAVADFWKSPDVNLQGKFSSAVTKYLSVNLFVQLIYDKFDSAADVDPSRPLADQISDIDRNVRKAGQFKETLALGLSYRLF